MFLQGCKGPFARNLVKVQLELLFLLGVDPDGIPQVVIYRRSAELIRSNSLKVFYYFALRLSFNIERWGQLLGILLELVLTHFHLVFRLLFLNHSIRLCEIRRL